MKIWTRPCCLRALAKKREQGTRQKSPAPFIIQRSKRFSPGYSTIMMISKPSWWWLTIHDITPCLLDDCGRCEWRIAHCPSRALSISLPTACCLPESCPFGLLLFKKWATRSPTALTFFWTKAVGATQMLVAMAKRRQMTPSYSLDYSKIVKWRMVWRYILTSLVYIV